MTASIAEPVATGLAVVSWKRTVVAFLPTHGYLRSLATLVDQSLGLAHHLINALLALLVDRMNGEADHMTRWAATPT